MHAGNAEVRNLKMIEDIFQSKRRDSFSKSKVSETQKFIFKYFFKWDNKNSLARSQCACY